MIFDDLHTPDDGNRDSIDDGLGYSPLQQREPASAPGKALPDREVPLPSNAVTTLMHQWLDGETSAAAVRAAQGGNETVDIWNRIHDEAETLRSRTTPLYVHKRIMDSLPDDTHRVRGPWYRRPVSMNPTALLIAAAVLLGIGALLARTLIR